MTVSRDSSDIKISEQSDKNIEEIAKICNIEPFSAALDGYDKTVLTAKIGDETVGFCASLLVLDEVDIVTVGVLPEYRKRGVGKALLNELVAKNREKGGLNFHLEVRESNAPAYNLYLSLGFVPCGTVKNYYKNPTEDAVRMVLTNEDTCV